MLKEKEELRKSKLAGLKAALSKGMHDIRNGDFEVHDQASLAKEFQASKVRARRKLVKKKNSTA
jgi:hypothetical protein